MNGAAVSALYDGNHANATSRYHHAKLNMGLVAGVQSSLAVEHEDNVVGYLSTDFS